MIAGLATLLCCQLIGEALARWLALPVPGPVIGMALLFLALLLRGGQYAVPPDRLGVATLAALVQRAGGDITVTILPDKVKIEAEDQGPGIENIDMAMQEGWSTAGRVPRELGFGAGMGLPNIKRCVDKLDIKSESCGTRLNAEIALKKAGEE
jgi:hypothetical protein